MYLHLFRMGRSGRTHWSKGRRGIEGEGQMRNLHSPWPPWPPSTFPICPPTPPPLYSHQTLYFTFICVLYMYHVTHLGVVCGNHVHMHVFGVCVYCKLTFVSFTTLSTSHASSPFQPALPHQHTFPLQPLICDPICLLLICGCVLCDYHNESLFDVMFLECP